jgi:hypothetical protein
LAAICGLFLSKHKIHHPISDKPDMKENEVCNLKEKLLTDAYNKVKREDFPNQEAYQHYLNGLEDGILNFYSAYMMQILADEIKPLKKTA